MAEKLIGSFVFISNGYGTISSVYHNRIDREPFPETAKRLPNKSKNKNVSDLFAGTYACVWIQTNFEIENTELEISLEENGTYRMRWYDGGGEYFHGIGFLHDNKIVGAYWEV